VGLDDWTSDWGTGNNGMGNNNGGNMNRGGGNGNRGGTGSGSGSNSGSSDDGRPRTDMGQVQSAINDPSNRIDSVISFPCLTRTVSYRVRCGDVVSVTLEPEDSCLANNFDPMTHPTMNMKSFKKSDFDGDVSTFVTADSSTTSFNALSVVGTNVRLEVEARDECSNVGSDSFDPSQACDGFVAGRCCPPVIAGPTRYQQDQLNTGPIKEINLLPSFP